MKKLNVYYRKREWDEDIFLIQRRKSFLKLTIDFYKQRPFFNYLEFVLIDII
jgi:hypothetical protein